MTRSATRVSASVSLVCHTFRSLCLNQGSRQRRRTDRTGARALALLLLAGALVPSFLVAQTAVPGSWMEQSPASSPFGRSYASMAYDASNGTVVLFGGVIDGFHNDTWTWNGTTWTEQAAAPAGLTARDGAGMVYDASTGTVVVFGGFNGSYLNDTWTWNGTRWTEQSPGTSPPARSWANMAYDASTGTVVLFGGEGGSGYLNDTWTWNGTTWTPQTPGTSPPSANSS